jgi:hypothetical protein
LKSYILNLSEATCSTAALNDESCSTHVRESSPVSAKRTPQNKANETIIPNKRLFFIFLFIKESKGLLAIIVQK